MKNIKNTLAKFSVIAFAFALILGFSLSANVEAAGTSWYVSPTGNNTNDCLSAVTTCLTIQAAINKASAGDIISVAAGTYAEHVTINKSLILHGANMGVAGSSPRGPESIITGDSTGAVQITANVVQMNGFKISSASNALGAGISMVSGPNSVLIKDNVITGNQIGVYANTTGDSMLLYNLFDANNGAGSPGGIGIYAENATGATSSLMIEGNEFKNNTSGSQIVIAGETAGANTNLSVTDNVFHNNTNGDAISVAALVGGTFTGNTITLGTGSNGFYFSGGDQNINVNHNTVSGGTNSALVESFTTGVGNNSNIVINRNGFTSASSYGMVNLSSATIPALDASCNWWGADSGPSNMGPGTGTGVSSNVTFSPWLSSANLNGTCTATTTTRTITASAGTNGTISPSGAVSVTDGNNQTFTITANTGFHVSDVLVDGASVGAVSNYTFNNVTANHTISTSFAANTVTSFTITSSTGVNGTISPLGAVSVNSGNNQTFTITANSGFHVSNVLVDGASVGAVTTYTFTNVTVNHTIAASFAADTNLLTVTLAGTGTGAVTSSPTGINCGVDCTENFVLNTPVTLTATAAAGSTFTGWSGVCSGTSTCSTTMSTARNATATFTLNNPTSFTITSSTGVNGNISPLGAVSVNSGNNQTFTITPNSGFHVSNVLVDGSSVGVVSTYTFNNVTANHTISVSFAENQSGGGTPSSKNECKNGGWMSFTNPKFKNQGQCVSYTNHR